MLKASNTYYNKKQKQAYILYVYKLSFGFYGTIKIIKNYEIMIFSRYVYFIPI